MFRKCFYTVENRGVEVDYSEEFFHELLFINIKRERKLAYILILLSSAMICLNTVFSVKKELHKDFASFPDILFSALIAGALIFLLVTRGVAKGDSINYKFMKSMHILINLWVLTVCAILAANAVVADEHPFAYVAAMYGIASVVYLHPSERLKVYGLSYIVYIMGVLLLIGNLPMLLDDAIFTIIIMSFAVTISSINYSSYHNNYIQKKTIQLKNQELAALYRKTDEALKMRTEELSAVKEYDNLRTAFFANLSHELRTPINVIFSAEQMIDHLLKSGQENWAEKNLGRYRRIIRQNCYRLIRMVSNLIDITKIDAGYFKINMRNKDIVAIIENITLSVAEYIESRRISLVFDTEMEEKVIACDPDKIERIMLNLLSNSVKYTPAGGHILVSMYFRDGNVIISESDTGIGIPEEMKATVFDRFVQVDRTTTRINEGSGIGLSIVRALVELHGGSISLESELGKGSEFIIVLPDRQLEEGSEVEFEGSAKEYQHIEKIQIEFSDIYE